VLNQKELTQAGKILKGGLEAYPGRMTQPITA